MAEILAKIREAETEAANLKAQIKQAKEAKKCGTLKDKAGEVNAQPVPKLKCSRTLKGHIGKIYSMHWAESSPLVVSAGQDGVLIVWDAVTTNKTHALALRCAWVMTCAFAPSGSYVASGGLDNTVSIYNLTTEEKAPRPLRELQGHDGHVSCCRFLNNKQLLSSSGDKSCRLWDIERGTVVSEFTEHNGDVLCLSLPPGEEKDTFVSGSTDSTAKVFDIRAGNMAQVSFDDHKSDINGIQYFPTGKQFVTVAEDGVGYLFDVRSAQPVQIYQIDNGFTSVALSKSGRYMFAGHTENPTVVSAWDTLKGNKLTEFKGHKARVSSVGVDAEGWSLCSASWDFTLKVWV